MENKRERERLRYSHSLEFQTTTDTGAFHGCTLAGHETGRVLLWAKWKRDEKGWPGLSKGEGYTNYIQMVTRRGKTSLLNKEKDFAKGCRPW